MIGLVGAAVLLQAGVDARAESTRTVEEVAAELADPLAPVTTIAGNLRMGTDNGPDDDTNWQLRLQPSFFKPCAGRSALLVRTVVPVRFNRCPARDHGLGNVSIISCYVPDTTATTFVGYGGALIAPTATEDSLVSGKWAAGPAVIVARAGQTITWGGLLQHVWSFAGASGRADVSVTTVQPFLTYLVAGGWSATVSSEATYNWSAGSERSWTVPFTLGEARVVRFGGEFVNLGIAYVRYLERPSYATESEIRLSATYVWR